MPTEQKSYAFVEHFTLNNGKPLRLRFGRVGGKVDAKPYPLEQAVADYTAKVLKDSGVKPKSLCTLEAYEKVGDAISQSSLLSKTLYISIGDLLSYCH